MRSPRAVDIAGVMVRSEEEAARLVDAQLRGVGPWSAKSDQTGADGLERATDAAGRWFPVFARTIAAHLEDGDVTVRTLAVVLCERVAREIGPRSIAQILERSARLFDGVKPMGHRTNQPDLRWSLLTALGSAVGPEDTDAIRVLREAVREERGYWLIDALARVDLEWLFANARDVIPKDSLGGALRTMPHTEGRQALIRALSPWTEAERKAALAGPFWALLPDAGEVRPLLDQPIAPR